MPYFIYFYKLQELSKKLQQLLILKKIRKTCILHFPVLLLMSYR